MLEFVHCLTRACVCVGVSLCSICYHCIGIAHVESLSMKNGLCVIGPHRQATAGDCQSNPICLSASTNQPAVGCVVLNGIFTH